MTTATRTEAQERASEALEQVERLRAAVVDELEEASPAFAAWLVAVLASAERTLHRHRPAYSSATALAAGELGCVGCGLTSADELRAWPCEDVLEVLAIYAAARPCACSDDYDRGGNRFVDPSDCPAHRPEVEPEEPDVMVTLGHFHGCPTATGKPFDCDYCQERARSMAGT